jgi:hypothetical protein
MVNAEPGSIPDSSSYDDPTRLVTATQADLTWKQATEFIAHLNNAGLDVEKMLGNPRLLAKLTEVIRSLVDEFVWDCGVHYVPAWSWTTITSGIEMRRPESSCSCGPRTNHILLRAKIENPSSDEQEKVPATTVHLKGDPWVDVAQGVQVRKWGKSDIMVRTLRSS